MKKNLQTTFSSRQYMLSEDFEIYYYKDDTLSIVSSHVHDYYEFYLFIEGNVTMHIQNRAYRLSPGDVILIPPNTRHNAQISGHDRSYRRIVLWISKDYCDQLSALNDAYHYMFAQAHEKKGLVFSNDEITFNAILGHAFHLIEEIHSHRFGKEAQVSLEINSLILYLNRLLYNYQHQDTDYAAPKLYERLIDYIDDHISENLTLDALSDYFHVSKYHISHTFKDSIGLSVHQYITKKRLALCKQALNNHMSITKVCQLYGFNDYTVFYRAFKKEFGVSPKTFTLPD